MSDDLRDIFTKLEAAEAEARARLPDDPPLRAAPRPTRAATAPQEAEPAMEDDGPDPANRRPISARNSRFARSAASRLAESDITPNQISQASIGFAALGLLVFWGASATIGVLQSMLLVVAAAAIQARLICNLLDGMVAVEGGKSSDTGPFWNEAPDRIADILLLWGAGLAAGHPALGLGAAALAVGTAYLRELGRAEGLAPDFSGPMAKPHRMAALTIGALAAALLPVTMTAAAILNLTLWVIVIGLVATIARRTWRLLAGLQAG
ncbi:CDP-alcohol phosphatidyltransferase family protein [Gemmobacter serpentinus]|uniref:CDP-alcohol phosphatidyltransferase family protein n=1 Tax=Gemmobacter serpentinus TaxID=2652247 RepID=UPI001CF651C3|nr:CDP-alcohol phosphatidyltransferase family protein [Gemmobacter serpentinus]